MCGDKTVSRKKINFELLRSSRLQGAGVRKNPLGFWTCRVISERAKTKLLMKQDNDQKT